MSKSVLIGCEWSGRVREAFNAVGWDAWSCDLEETAVPSDKHIVGDIRNVIKMKNFDMLIAFPPCTYLCSSGARWWKERKHEQQEAIDFVKFLYDCGIKRIAIENPIGILSTVWRSPSQIIHPWQFGHSETKSTCLWLRNLTPLNPSLIVVPKRNRIHRMSPSKYRSKKRGITYKGIASAMAQQWGSMQ